MNLPLYIASRISKSSTGGYSGTIIKIAIASIALSVAIMILSTSVINGFKSGISDKIFGFWGNIHITDTRINRSFELEPIFYNQATIDSIMSISALAYVDTRKGSSDKEQHTRGGVKDISPFITLPAMINRENRLEGIILKGINAEYNWSNFERYLKQGSFPDLSDSIPSREILVSEQTANRLKLKIHDKIVLHFVQDRKSIKREMRVSGLYRTGLEIYDKRFAFMDIKLLQTVLGWDQNQIGGYEVFLDNIKDAIPIADYIYEMILPPHLYAETIQEKFSSEFEWLELQNINESILLILMILVSIINMSTAILILILERTKMVGVLKALGLKDWGIRKIFIYNALWIMSIALVVGNILGIGIGLIQKHTGFLKLEEKNYYLSEVPIKFDPGSILLINIGAIVIIGLVMILPTYLVTRLSPIKILRFE